MIELLKQYQRYDKPIISSKYHKEYVKGQKDYYVGITVPTLRKLAKNHYMSITPVELLELMTNSIHEYRLLALFVLEQKMLKAKSVQKQEKIVGFYLNHISHVNNWDLVDASCYQILGKYLYNIENYDLLYEFAEKADLWLKRISIVATYHLIRNNIFSVSLDIIDILLEDTHDLIHKANGWKLRNIGDKDKDLLTEYIFINYNKMPRTTLRYAIEHYPEFERKAILKGDFTWR